MVAILLVPQAIAYAYLAGMPPQYGLYTALVPCIIYTIFGTSPHLAIGPVAVSALLVAAGLGQLSVPFSEEYIGLVILSGLFIGLLQLIMGILRLGIVINLLSYPVITGFTSAASIIVIVNQLKDICGIEVPRFDLLYDTLLYIFERVYSFHLPTLIVGFSTFILITLLKKINKKIPYGLVVVSLGIALSYFLDFDQLGIQIIGNVPSGLPSFGVPSLAPNDILAILPTVILVTIIGIIESISIAKAIESKHDYYNINTNQELRALGISKICGSFFSSIPSSGSFSRSALLNESGAKTTVASLTTVVFVVLSLLFLTPLLFYLPKVILAIIIVFAVKNLFEYALAKSLYKTNKLDLSVMVITFLGTIFISIEIGVVIGFLTSIFVVIISGQNRLNALKKIFLFREFDGIDISDSSEELRVSVEGQLNFGNASYLKNKVLEYLDNEDKSYKSLILDLKYTDDVDSTGLKTIIHLHHYAEANEIDSKILAYNPKIGKRFSRSGKFHSL